MQACRSARNAMQSPNDSNAGISGELVAMLREAEISSIRAEYRAVFMTG